MNELKNLISFGNKKLSKEIAIFNMQPAKNCSSKKLGLCKVCKICYANKAEYLYPSVLPYRLRQEKYWSNTDASKFVNDFLLAIANKKTKVKYLRISESGDFNCQSDIDKLVLIANKLKKYNIQVYTYTARTDLNFENIENLVVNGSGFLVSNNFSAVPQLPETLNKNEKICKGNCRLCKLCTKKNNNTIYIKYH
jgi:hypothetical protein